MWDEHFGAAVGESTAVVQRTPLHWPTVVAAGVGASVSYSIGPAAGSATGTVACRT